MNKLYKIGEVSKITGLSVETIRFFESKGLIVSKKKEYSKYRYFDIWDINRLLDYQKLRSLDFSLPEAIETIHNKDLNGFAAILNKKKIDVEKQAEYLRKKSAKLENYKNVVLDLPLHDGYFHIVKQPGLYFYKTRSFHDGTMYFEIDDEHLEVQRQLYEYRGFVENTFLIRPHDLEDGRSDYSWGMSVKEIWKDLLDPALLDQMEYIPSSAALYGTIKELDTSPFRKESFQPMFAFLKKRNLFPSNGVIGNQVATIHEEGGTTRYMEVWIPIHSSRE